MCRIKIPTGLFLVLLALVVAGLAPAARADVTIEERSTFDFTVIKAHGNSVELTTADKQRRSSELHCEGFLSVFCRDVQSAEITRLDRDVSWVLEPKKKQYSEARFPTPAERQAAERQAQETLEKMKQCPTPASPTPTPASTPDTSGCEMTPAKFDVKQTDQRATFAGHDAQLTQLAMTQSCQNKQTGDTCDFVMTLDSWLSQDQIPGIDDRKAFQAAYLHKLGLDDPNSLVQTQLRQFMAPYAKSLKELAAKSGDLKGYPLKTAFRVSFGGERCAAAKRSDQGGVSAGWRGRGEFCRGRRRIRSGCCCHQGSGQHGRGLDRGICRECLRQQAGGWPLCQKEDGGRGNADKRPRGWRRSEYDSGGAVHHGNHRHHHGTDRTRAVRDPCRLEADDARGQDGEGVQLSEGHAMTKHQRHGILLVLPSRCWSQMS
jgi:hypothetical protein